MIANVPIRESGIVTTGMTEARTDRRKANTTRATIARLSSNVLITSVIDPRTLSVAS